MEHTFEVIFEKLCLSQRSFKSFIELCVLCTSRIMPIRKQFSHLAGG
jgi:hypothetical protein